MTWLSGIMALCVLFGILYLFMPEGSAKKGVGILMAIIISLQILSLFCSFGKETVAEWFLSIRNAEILTGENPDEMAQIFDDYERKCVDEIKKYVEQQDSVASCEVKLVVNRDTDSERMGYLEHIYLYVSFVDQNEKDASWIKPIEIIPLDRWEGDAEISKQQNNLKKIVSNWLSLDYNCISIFEKEDYHE